MNATSLEDAYRFRHPVDGYSAYWGDVRAIRAQNLIRYQNNPDNGPKKEYLGDRVYKYNYMVDMYKKSSGAEK